MNHSKLVFSLSCFVAVTLAAPILTAAPRGGGGHGGGHFGGGRSFAGRPGMSAGGGRNWNGRNWNNWNGRWNGRNWRNWNGKWSWWNGNRWCHSRSNVVFIGDFGFPWWWGFGWGPWSDWGYPYGYYGYGYPYYGYGYGYPGYGYGDYGYSYGYGNGNSYGSQYSSATRSRVGELQRRLARAGYYRGSIDGVLGPQTRRAIRAYEQEHGYVDAS
jgi:hypothetical protein